VSAQQAPGVEQAEKIQQRLQSLLSGFQAAAPEEAAVIFQKLGIRYTPPPPPPAPAQE